MAAQSYNPLAQRRFGALDKMAQRGTAPPRPAEAGSVVSRQRDTPADLDPQEHRTGGSPIGCDAVSSIAEARVSSMGHQPLGIPVVETLCGASMEGKPQPRAGTSGISLRHTGHILILPPTTVGTGRRPVRSLHDAAHSASAPYHSGGSRWQCQGAPRHTWPDSIGGCCSDAPARKAAGSSPCFFRRR